MCKKCILECECESVGLFFTGLHNLLAIATKMCVFFSIPGPTQKTKTHTHKIKKNSKNPKYKNATKNTLKKKPKTKQKNESQCETDFLWCIYNCIRVFSKSRM